MRWSCLWVTIAAGAAVACGGSVAADASRTDASSQDVSDGGVTDATSTPTPDAPDDALDAGVVTDAVTGLDSADATDSGSALDAADAKGPSCGGSVVCADGGCCVDDACVADGALCPDGLGKCSAGRCGTCGALGDVCCAESKTETCSSLGAACPGCTQAGTTCNGKSCVACGTLGQPCCAFTACTDPFLRCDVSNPGGNPPQGTCGNDCGNPGQPCCEVEHGPGATAYSCRDGNCCLPGASPSGWICASAPTCGCSAGQCTTCGVFGKPCCQYGEGCQQGQGECVTDAGALEPPWQDGGGICGQRVGI